MLEIMPKLEVDDLATHHPISVPRGDGVGDGRCAQHHLGAKVSALLAHRDACLSQLGVAQLASVEGSIAQPISHVPEYNGLIFGQQKSRV
jgi:hypothetical protein